jgi:uncharacterized protein
MSPRPVRRRDFSGSWVLGDDARWIARVLKKVLEFPARIPAPLFALALAGLAWGGSWGRLGWAVGLWLFMLGDWTLLRSLPRFGKSYGPPQPACLALAIPRAALGALPLPLAIAFQLAGTALAYYGLWIEPHRIGTTRQVLRSPKLEPGAPLRVLHLSDLHVERVTGRERELVERAALERPDLIAISGDLLNTSYVRDPEAWASCRWVLERLSAPLGTFLVSGSPSSDPDDALERIVDGLPVRWLRDQRVTVHHRGRPFDLIGLRCTHRPFLERPRLEALLAAAPSPFTLLLYHAPDLAPDAAELGIDWMLCGHTHGGQVRLPGLGALVTSSLYGKAFEMGRYQVGDMTLYVSRGIGMEGSGAPRVRFLCPPEIVAWEVHGGPVV